MWRIGLGLLLQLERHGIDARVSPSRIRFLPESRNQTDGPVRARLVVAADDQVDDLRDALDAELHRGKAVVAYDVAVFLDESPETAGVPLP